jgi:hypothetical protein
MVTERELRVYMVYRTIWSPATTASRAPANKAKICARTHHATLRGRKRSLSRVVVLSRSSYNAFASLRDHAC